MVMKAKLITLSCVLLLAGCVFDHGIEWRSGSYGLVWVDLPDEVSLSYDMGNGAWATVVEPSVFAVGANGRYVVAQQHPRGDKRITSYFIVDVRAGAPKGDSKDGVIGPLTEREFETKAATLPLPPFTKILDSVR
jgi:hypothetical protein